MRANARLSLLAAKVLLVATLAPSRASAFERQHHVGGGLGGAALSASDGAGLNMNAAFTAHYAYGFSDAFNVVAEVGGSHHTFGSAEDPRAPHTLPSTVLTGGVGAVYILDVLRWIPYGGALLGAGYFGGGNLDKGVVTPDLQLALGLDYAVTRNFALGVAFRQHVFFLKTDTYPSYTAGFLRAEYTFGW